MAGPGEGASGQGALVLSEIGSFHVGGRALAVAGRPTRRVSYSLSLPDVEYDPNGHFHVEQAYVQYFIPVTRRFATPLLLVHGGGLTGATWETTPDGRPGWLRFFLQAGVATYVIDNAERGRAGFCAHDGEWAGGPVVRSDEEAWWLYRFGPAGSFDGRSSFAGQQFPIEAMAALTRQTVPRWPANDAILLAGLEAAIDRIGPCVALGHSQGGGLAARAALARRDTVRALVAVEPHGTPAEFDPAAVNGRSGLLVMGDFIDQVPTWQGLDAQARTSFANWAAAGGRTTVLSLPEHGLAGNSHMIMMDRNSDAVAGLLLDWLDQEHAAGRLP